MKSLASVWLMLILLSLPPHALMQEGAEKSDFYERRKRIFSSVSHSPILLDDTTAVFVYRGAAESVSLAGDWNGWRPQKMNFDPALCIWYAILVLPAKARLDYKFVINETEWILDPANPRVCRGGFGDNSELAMPHYQCAEETIPRSNIPAGILVDSTWYSYSFHQRRSVQLYFPANSRYTGDDLPMVLFLDGKDFLDAGSAKVVLDNLIAVEKIPPLIAVFDSPFDRISEYAGLSADALETYIVSELLSKVSSVAKISKNPAQRAIIGVSLSAVFASRLVQRHPDQFGCCAAFSPAYWYDDQKVFREIKHGEFAPVRFYLDRGLFEGNSIAWADSMKYLLEQKGVSVCWRIWPEGHSWGSWKAHLDEALVFFFAETE